MRGDGRIYERAGSSALWCAYYLRGKQYRESTGTADSKQAAKYLKNKLKEVHADEIGARTFVTPQQRKTTVGELLDALLAHYKVDGKDNPKVRSNLKRIREHFGDWRAANVSPEAIDKYILEVRAEGKADATINRGTQLLGQAFKLAVRSGTISGMPYIKHLSEKGNARQGFFSKGEVNAVVSNLPARLQDFTLFAFHTGMRKGEIQSLRWEDVRGDVVWLRGENAKNGEARHIPLEGELVAIMERRKAARAVKGETVTLSDFIFHDKGVPIGEFRKSWATACRMAGVPGKLFHDLRRSAVRNMVQGGTPEIVAMKISGHKTRSIFDRYNIVSDNDTREAMKRTQGYLMAEETKQVTERVQ